MAETAVVDASPLIILAQGQRLELLRVAAERIVVPTAVAVEVRRPGSADPAALALRSLPWLELAASGMPAAAVRLWRLDAGEEAVLTWALAHPGSAAIIDDLRGRRAARALGIPTIGTLGLIAEAKARGLIAAARPLIEHLLTTTDWYLSPQLMAQVLTRLGE